MNNRKNLLIYLDGSIGYGGTFMFIYNLLPYLSAKYNIEIVQTISKESTKNDMYKILSRDFIIYDLYIESKLDMANKFKKILKGKDFDIIHINFSKTSYAFITSLIAHYHSKAKIILHSHSNGVYKGNFISNFLLKIMTYILSSCGDELVACSEEAGKVKFNPRKYEKCGLVINDSINTSKFSYSIVARRSIRQELDIDASDFVLITVGRLSPEKNHRIIIDALPYIISKMPNIKYVIVGDGSEKDRLQLLCYQKQLTDYVIFTGNKQNINDYLSAADLFVFPSLYEGFGIAALEAQASGLSVLCSSGVSSKVNVTGNVEFIDVESSSITWSEMILNHRLDKRYNASHEIAEKGFDSQSNALRISNLYERGKW